MKRRKQEKGITLVALVITIIVLLILAGVTINVAIRTGLMSKSENAVDKYLDQERVEADRLDAIEKRMGELSGMKDNTEGTEHTKMIEAKDYSYKNPVIPAGFKTSSDGASWSVRNEEEVLGWNDGLVIEDAQGNQFVWVPVDGKNVTYTKWLGDESNPYESNPNITSLDQLSDDLPNGVMNENLQIGTYGGFYIGRYEAGIPENLTSVITSEVDGGNKIGVPVVKKNQAPWYRINYTYAKDNAESMCNTTKVKSGLLTGTMWDTTLKWLKNSGVDVDENSVSWGNYRYVEIPDVTWFQEMVVNMKWKNVSTTTKNNGIPWLLKTGHTDFTKRNNIYDLAGNLAEWTSEALNDERIIRSIGTWKYNDRGTSLIYRSNSVIGNNFVDRGFRVALYIQ